MNNNLDRSRELMRRNMESMQRNQEANRRQQELNHRSLDSMRKQQANQDQIQRNLRQSRENSERIRLQAQQQFDQQRLRRHQQQLLQAHSWKDQARLDSSSLKSSVNNAASHVSDPSGFSFIDSAFIKLIILIIQSLIVYFVGFNFFHFNFLAILFKYLKREWTEAKHLVRQAQLYNKVGPTPKVMV